MSRRLSARAVTGIASWSPAPSPLGAGTLCDNASVHRGLVAVVRQALLGELIADHLLLRAD
jgi:hypothetical protein